MPPTLLGFATDGAAMQGEDNNAEQWYAVTAVAYHRDQKIQLGGGLIGTERAGNLMSARVIESAISLSQHILVEWQAKGKPIPAIFVFTKNGDSIG